MKLLIISIILSSTLSLSQYKDIREVSILLSRGNTVKSFHIPLIPKFQKVYNINNEFYFTYGDYKGKDTVNIKGTPLCMFLYSDHKLYFLKKIPDSLTIKQKEIKFENPKDNKSN